MSISDPYLPVFVYGTLRRGEKNYPLYLQPHAVKVVPAHVKGVLYFIEKEGYPYLLPGSGTVVGDLVFIPPEGYEDVLFSLDELENYHPGNEKSSLYLRRREAVYTASGEVLAWVYYWNGPRTGRRIDRGDFRKRQLP